jgi:FKBP-type peptidyl-prolyl cis-trans isomerase
MKLMLTILGIFCATTALTAIAHEEDESAVTEAKPVPAKKAAKKKKADSAKAKKNETKTEAKGKAETRPDGLVIEDLKVGNGMEAKLGTKITVHYRGTFKNGKEFDSSYKSGSPATFPLEEGGLIKGWTEGIPGMKVGGKRKLLVPFALGYGESGTPNGDIPPHSDLNFEVELLKVE